MMVTLIIIASLLAGAAVVVAMQLGSNRGTDLTRSGMTAEYCAEAGAERAAPIVAANPLAWGSNMCTAGSEAACLPTIAGVPSPSAEVPLLAPPAIVHDLDGDGIADFVLYLRDDDDENSTVQNRGSDINNQVYLVSTCIKFPDTPRQVKELFRGGGAGVKMSQVGGGIMGDGNLGQ